jgi:hypothetical protein
MEAAVRFDTKTDGKTQQPSTNMRAAHTARGTLQGVHFFPTARATKVPQPLA